MKFVLAVLVTLAAAPAIANQAAPSYWLTVDGLGPVKIGMTVAQAEKALGARLKMFYSEENDPKSCGTGNRADGKNADVFYLVEDGHIGRVEIVTLDTGSPSKPAVRTAKDVGLGSTEAEVKAAYGTALKVEPHPYLGPAGHYLVVKSPDGKTGLIFETDGKTVIEFRAGAYPQVGYIEGCA